ncbi:hypothetical protein DFA_04107 [Cavenderia fasciculata]|uniref:Uncharacterized protein n=1 Tax=Cavenderia fasciculata TaxID=261658 RepID=F4Q1B2_CACFS|nr:uncharacterized protein DFA_04107 [Cavenderia fasciculata]EGG18613.1 hypothetical protein DFA_04107 [Cavenderia fasciculata]|eukprot:XP_004366517.1 hypothetical protein DFA_04107 [Cavenderia fasciculata]
MDRNSQNRSDPFDSTGKEASRHYLIYYILRICWIGYDNAAFCSCKSERLEQTNNNQQDQTVSPSTTTTTTTSQCKHHDEYNCKSYRNNLETRYKQLQLAFINKKIFNHIKTRPHSFPITFAMSECKLVRKPSLQGTDSLLRNASSLSTNTQLFSEGLESIIFKRVTAEVLPSIKKYQGFITFLDTEHPTPNQITHLLLAKLKYHLVNLDRLFSFTSLVSLSLSSIELDFSQLDPISVTNRFDKNKALLLGAATQIFQFPKLQTLYMGIILLPGGDPTNIIPSTVTKIVSWYPMRPRISNTGLLSIINHNLHIKTLKYNHRASDPDIDSNPIDFALECWSDISPKSSLEKIIATLEHGQRSNLMTEPPTFSIHLEQSSSINYIGYFISDYYNKYIFFKKNTNKQIN